MNGTRHREVGEYVRRLQRAMRDLPAGHRNEILAEIEEHIDDLLSEKPGATHVDVLNVLDRVGDPEDIAAEARERFGITPPRRSWTDPAAIVLLLIGGFTFIGWFVGVVLLWISDAWNTRDKLIGTLIVPGGLAGSLAIGLVSVNTSTDVCRANPSGVDAVDACGAGASTFGSAIQSILLMFVLIAPILTAVYLSRRLARARRTGVEAGAR